MTELLNKLLAIFHLKLVSTKTNTKLVKKTVKFLDKHKDFWSNDNAVFFPSYVGDINYIQEIVKDEFPQVSGQTYVLQRGTEDKYYTYDGDSFTPDQLQEKLND